ITTENQDRRLRILVLRDRFSTSRAIANWWFEEPERVIGMRMIYRRIRSFRLFSYRPHWVERVQWDQQWNSVVFTDESRFCLGMNDGRARVRRRRGERRDPQFDRERHVHHTV
ncbi:unnamed protein product, partial [Tenebrio molitor]